MENLFQFWWIAVAFAVVLVVALVRRNHSRKRVAAQYRADESTIINIYNDFRGGDISTYKDLPNLTSRLDWMKRHYTEFMEAAERHFLHNPSVAVEGVVAVHLDLRLLRGLYEYESRDSVLRTYQTSTSRISLNQYQVQVDESNAEQAKWKEAELKVEAKYRAEQQALRVKEEAAEKIRKNVAKTYWKSLSEEQKEAFKKAEGQSARQRALPSSASTGYSSDVLYSLIMATQFSSIGSDTSRSIDYCESPSYESSTYSDSGSSYSDSGSSYSDSGSSSCDGGGGGGGE